MGRPTLGPVNSGRASRAGLHWTADHMPHDEEQIAPKRRVLLLIKCLGYGGAEQLLVHMVRHRDRVNFDYEVAFILDGFDALVPQIEEAGVTVHGLGAKSNADLSWTLRLRDLLRRQRYDIVHAHLPYAATIGRLVAATLPRRTRPALVY